MNPMRKAGLRPLAASPQITIPCILDLDTSNGYQPAIKSLREDHPGQIKVIKDVLTAFGLECARITGYGWHPTADDTIRFRLHQHKPILQVGQYEVVIHKAVNRDGKVMNGDGLQLLWLSPEVQEAVRAIHNKPAAKPAPAVAPTVVKPPLPPTTARVILKAKPTNKAAVSMAGFTKDEENIRQVLLNVHSKVKVEYFSRDDFYEALWQVKGGGERGGNMSSQLRSFGQVLIACVKAGYVMEIDKSNLGFSSRGLQLIGVEIPMPAPLPAAPVPSGLSKLQDVVNKINRLAQLRGDRTHMETSLTEAQAEFDAAQQYLTEVKERIKQADAELAELAKVEQGLRLAGLLD